MAYILQVQDKKWQASAADAHQLHSVIHPWQDPADRPDPQAFFLPAAHAQPVKAGGWTGAVSAGSSVNCATVTLCAHGCGTHAEGLGHATIAPHHLWEHIPVPCGPLACSVLTPQLASVASLSEAQREGLTAAAEPEDQVVTAEALQAAASAASYADVGVLDGWNQAVVVRAAPASDGPRVWSGHNPPYFTPAATGWLREVGIRVLATDLPSMDKESDGGVLGAHRAFWGLPPASAGRDETEAAAHRLEAEGRLVVEMCTPPSAQVQPDGPACLLLGVAPLAMDAAPAAAQLCAVQQVLS